ncbi:hypothetical protein HUG17_9328 [Dermatophagoides farinae]|uniref:BTB domain-containing protein n=1 Tax=Dermatophagoides farinae TaxID=6954 RepID=A0A9D4NU83_DERFA|nr:hypothetical protein HUG17_9328 [Dermatophagoides farinae]
MARSATETIDINLFQDDFKNIDQKFLQSVVSICGLYTYEDKKQFLLMTDEATYGYGKQICSWLSLKHDMSKPQRISLLNDMKIFQVDYGRDFVAILTKDGQVFLASDVDSMWKTKRTLRLISTNNDRFKMIACGYFHLLMLREDGHVFAMGSNFRGQITGNEISSYESMIQIENQENVELIACGAGHSFSITNKREIYAWGDNDFGQLGFGERKKRNTPCLVAFQNDDSTQIKDIVAGYGNSLFLFENGQLWGCGYNYNGELGLGNRRSKLTKIPIGNLKQIKCSKFHNFSLAYDGSSYYAWGKTIYGKWLSSRKLNGQPASFSAASAMILKSPITFGLTTRIFEFHEPISTKSIIRLFNNPDNYDVKFIIGDRRILACKCYLKSASEYYCLMFSGYWIENDQVNIENYSYETYYEYLRMLHYDCIEINRNIISQLIDLATCYIDKRLMKHCETFIRNDLNEQTMPTYLPLINKYEMKELYEKLAHLYKNPQQSSTKRTKFF